jgi:valyl-tRNA synthetase
MIERYSADAVRYWAASTSLGKDAQISEEKIQSGSRLVTKLWNVARFSQRFLAAYHPPVQPPGGTPADRWILSRLLQTIEHVTHAFENYEYAAAKHDLEGFFWNDLTDQYLEMAKLRLYDEANPGRSQAIYALYHCLLAAIQMFAPILPFVTEAIFQQLFAETASESIHRTRWPVGQDGWRDPQAGSIGEHLTGITSIVRKYKSERSLSLAAPLPELTLAASEESIRTLLRQSEADLLSVSRASTITVTDQLPAGSPALNPGAGVLVAIGEPAQDNGKAARDHAPQAK